VSHPLPPACLSSPPPSFEPPNVKVFVFRPPSFRRCGRLSREGLSLPGLSFGPHENLFPSTKGHEGFDCKGLWSDRPPPLPPRFSILFEFPWLDPQRTPGGAPHFWKHIRRAPSLPVPPPIGLLQAWAPPAPFVDRLRLSLTRLPLLPCQDAGVVFSAVGKVFVFLP